MCNNVQILMNFIWLVKGHSLRQFYTVSLTIMKYIVLRTLQIVFYLFATKTVWEVTIIPHLTKEETGTEISL